MGELKMWHDGYDWVIAETAEEAARLAQGHTGEKDPILQEAIDAFEVWGRPTLKMTEDEGSSFTEMPVEWWIAEKGKGFLCSTEF
jgi:hypothetical protein